MDKPLSLVSRRKAAKVGCVCLMVVLFCFMIVSVRSGFRDIERDVVAQRMKAIVMALRHYAAQKGGDMPEADGVAGLQELIDSGVLTEPRCFVPAEHAHAVGQGTTLTEALVDYWYVGAGTLGDDNSTVVLIQKLRPGARAGLCARLSGEVEWLEGREWDEACSLRSTHGASSPSPRQ